MTQEVGSQNYKEQMQILTECNVGSLRTKINCAEEMNMNREKMRQIWIWEWGNWCFLEYESFRSRNQPFALLTRLLCHLWLFPELKNWKILLTMKDFPELFLRVFTTTLASFKKESWILGFFSIIIRYDFIFCVWIFIIRYPNNFEKSFYIH